VSRRGRWDARRRGGAPDEAGTRQIKKEGGVVAVGSLSVVAAKQTKDAGGEACNGT